MDGLGNRPVEQQVNNFGLVRLAAATLVIFGHGFTLAGAPGFDWLNTRVDALALRVFFVLSGYLICESWNRDPVIGRYLIKRVLRIGPGLVALVLVTALVLGPLRTTLPLGAYFTDPAFGTYFWNIALLPAFALPGLFQGQVMSAVNGSLWSIPGEFLMYLLVPLYGARRVWVCRVVIFPAVLALFIGGGLYYAIVVPEQLFPVVYGSSIPALARCTPYFIMGAAFSMWRLERYLSLPAAVVLAGVLSIPFLPYAPFHVAMFVATPYLVLSFALTPDRWLSRVGRRVDVSYGTYLYAFPIQQLLLSFGPLRPWTLIALTIPLAYLCGLLSWVLIERPAMRWKPWNRATRDVRTAAAPANTIPASL